MNSFFSLSKIVRQSILWLSILSISALFWLIVKNVQSGICYADILLARCVVVMLIVVAMQWIAIHIMGIRCESEAAGGYWSLLDSFVITEILYFVLLTLTGGKNPCASLFLITTEMVLLYFALRRLMTLRKVSSELIIIGLMICAIYEAGWGLGQLINGTSHHYLYPMTGSFQNPGPYSAFLMMGSAIGLAWMQEANNSRLQKIVMIVTIAMIVILSATWSRAAWLSLAIVAMILYRRYYWQWRWVVWSGCVALCVVFYYLKQGSADGRLLTWAAALTSWLHHPWLGVGIGGFLQAVANGIAELYAANPTLWLYESGDVTEFAFNDLLKILVEQGIIGFLLCILTVVYLLYLLWVHSKPLFYGMLSLVIFSIFSYPFELLPYKIIFVIVAAWVASVHSWKNDPRRAYCWVLLSLLLIYPSYLTAKEINRRYEADKEYKLFAGIENEAFIKDYYELLPNERDNAWFLFDFGKTLRSVGRYNDSNDMLRQGTQISADPMFYVLMGNNYKDMDCYDLAEESYFRAFSVMPNRIYPLYQLMKLYKEAGKVDKATEYARRIVSFKEKVISPATKQIKEEANSCLEEINKNENL